MSFRRVPSKPTNPRVIRAVADVPKMIPRLLAGTATLKTLADEYDVNICSIRAHIATTMTPGQYRAWQEQTRVANGKRKWLPIGSVKTHHGKRWIKVTDDPYGTARNWIALARFKWELVHGTIPKSHVLWFRDRDPMHDDVENLELLSRGHKIRRLLRRPAVERKRRVRQAMSKRRNNAVRRAMRDAAVLHNAPAEAERFTAPAQASAREQGRANALAFVQSLDAA